MRTGVPILFFLLILFSPNLWSATASDFIFQHLTLKEGLSNSNINSIVQDSNGFIWIGTENGLNKYDGYRFTHYFSDVNEQNSLFSNEILTLLVDSEGVLWVGTFQGLFKYNEVYDNFENILIDSVNLSQVNIPVYAILEDTEDILWVGASGNGLIKYNKKTLDYVTYHHNDSLPNSLSSDFIFTIFKDSKNKLWIGTSDNGLDQFERETNKFYNYKPVEHAGNQQNVNAILTVFEYNDSTFLLGTRGDGLFIFNKRTKKFNPYVFLSDNKSHTPYEIYGIFKDHKERLWISVHGKGLYYFTKGSSKVQHIEHQKNVNTSLINNNCRTIFEDRQGNLWIASWQGGINFLPNNYKKFKSYNLYDEGSVYVSNTVTSICTDTKGNRWVGTDGSGLKYIDKKGQKTKHFYPGVNTSDFIPDKVVMSLLLENDSKLWIGSYLGGLSVYNIEKKKFKNYKASDDPKSLSCNFVSCILKSSRGDIWVGTNGGGINEYNKKEDSFLSFEMNDTLNETRLVNNYVNTLAEDNNGRIWIGTFWGLSIYDPLNGLFFNYLRDEVNKLSNNTIYCIKITSKNEIWIGTRNGLNKFIPSKYAFQSFNLADGLPGNVVYSIEEDNAGLLWLSTNNGLCNFNPQTFETRSYFESDGLLSNEFYRHASYEDKLGEIYFGGIKGLNSFKPESVEENYQIPNPIITQFRIFDQEIYPGKGIMNDEILEKPIYLTDTIILKHKYNSFGFEFAAMDFILPEKNIYKVKMEGFDQEWRQMSFNQRYITYTNLDAETYTFRVKASSIDNEWNDETRDITLIIKPPLYRTWWAYSFYYLLLLGGVLLFWMISIRRVKLRNAIKLERLNREKANEINQAKLKFFTNVSHEFRTPITLIMGPLEKLMKDKGISKKYAASLNLMFKNANRLLRLINQLMDLRKMEAGKMRLKTEKLDIIPFLKDIHNNFLELASQKNIEFRFLTEIQTLFCWFDADKIDKIIFNLLSNAFKFTNENGEISVVVEEFVDIDAKRKIKILVIDSGKGIPEKNKDRIFERFYQTTDSTQHHNAGSGVGLSLTKSLVEQHYGKISFTSVENRGTEFMVILPLDENVFSDEEKFSSEVPGVNKYIHESPEGMVENEVSVDLIRDKNSTLLIVEDNYDLRKYIVNEFAEYYNIIEAANGKEALELALQSSPDVIISDVVMPEMDGLELCRRIKENFITNHIPIILLTARASIEHRIKGIEQGADSYIPKPFNPEHLKVRVKKLLELRLVLKQKYAYELDSPDVPIVVEEDIYLKEIKTLILENIDDPEMNIEKICKEMGISRAHFYRKIKLITDKSPTEFVRVIRLNEAAKHLMKNQNSISEICYMVGFNSPSYFSICFKEHFKISPIDFVKNNSKK